MERDTALHAAHTTHGEERRALEEQLARATGDLAQVREAYAALQVR